MASYSPSGNINALAVGNVNGVQQFLAACDGALIDITATGAVRPLMSRPDESRIYDNGMSPLGAAPMERSFSQSFHAS